MCRFRTLPAGLGGSRDGPISAALTGGHPRDFQLPPQAMRLVTWNCFRGDAAVRANDLADLDADVIVLQECARPALGTPERDRVVWFADNPKHGTAVVVRAPYAVRPAPFAVGDTDSVWPVRIEHAETGHAIHLLAVWAKPRPTYVQAVSAGLDVHGAWLREAPAVVLGDFNSHPSLDRGTGMRHEGLVARLRDEFGLVSAWHAVAERAGDVPEPATHYHQWRAERGFHIDYCFVPASWADDTLQAWIPDEPAGSRRSDHRPLVVDVAPTRSVVAASS